MKTNPTRVFVLFTVLAVATITTAGCAPTCPEDTDGKPCIHRCTDQVTFSAGWSFKGLLLDHQEFRECPVDISNPALTTGGKVRDTGSQDFTKMKLRIRNAVGAYVAERSQDFSDNPLFGWSADLSIAYTAATGGVNFDWARYEMDSGTPWAEVLLDYSGEGLPGPNTGS